VAPLKKVSSDLFRKVLQRAMWCFFCELAYWRYKSRLNVLQDIQKKVSFKKGILLCLLLVRKIFCYFFFLLLQGS